MTNQINLTLRQFPVVAHDHRTGKEEAITVILSVDELEVLYGRYSGNFTMQRLIARHVGQLADGEKDPEKRKRLIMLARAAEAGPAGVLDTWKNLEDTARICTGQAHGKGEPRYVLSISSQWEKLTENTIKNF